MPVMLFSMRLFSVWSNAAIGSLYITSVMSCLSIFWSTLLTYVVVGL